MGFVKILHCVTQAFEKIELKVLKKKETNRIWTYWKESAAEPLIYSPLFVLRWLIESTKEKGD